ncbi:MAG: hypothetical protein ACFB9M_06430 [Myxococcota bacterium]
MSRGRAGVPRTALWLGGALFLAGFFYWALTPSIETSRTVRPSPRQAPVSSGGTQPSAVPRGSVLDVHRSVRRAASATPREPEPAPPGTPESVRPTSQLPGPLMGIQVTRLTEADLRIANVPSRFRGGVRLDSVHVDSPAAEVALRPGDIIVRAQTTMVYSEAGLRALAGTRDYIRIMFVRDGDVRQVVLKRPFESRK